VAFRRGRTVASQYVGRVFSRSPRALAHEVGAGSRPVIASGAGSGSAIPSSFHPPELVDLRAGEERLLKQAEYVAVGVVEPGPTPGIRRHEHAVLGPDVWKVVVLQRQPACPQFGDRLIDFVDDKKAAVCSAREAGRSYSESMVPAPARYTTRPRRSGLPGSGPPTAAMGRPSVVS
jgi:hypothetical protein